MYYREKWINGELHYTLNPKGNWIPFTKEDYTQRVLELEKQVKKCDLADVVEPNGKLKCGNCGSIKLRKSLRNQKVYCLECKDSRAF